MHACVKLRRFVTSQACTRSQVSLLTLFTWATHVNYRCASAPSSNTRPAEIAMLPCNAEEVSVVSLKS